MTPLPPDLTARFLTVRARTEALLEGLLLEDMGLQSEPDVSPPRWHLGHTTWFFETFVLLPYLRGAVPFDARFGFVFNSYYEAEGPRQPRARRGDLSRPDQATVLAWRAATTEAVVGLLRGLDDDDPDAATVRARVALGIEHECQHQELLVMDTKANLAAQPLQPAWRTAAPRSPTRGPETAWVEVDGGIVAIGHAGGGFCFDNELPRHDVLLAPFALASRCVTAGEWAAFLDDGGYRDPRWWLSDGWAWVQAGDVQAPRYWSRDGEGGWLVYTPHGVEPVAPDDPVVHVSGYEAEAFAAWSGARLPTEHEWEHAAAGRDRSGDGTWLDGDRWHPAPPTAGPGVRGMLGTVWEWTRSAYLPYPGYRPAPGALGEYNGKFMSGQWVLRGGCCVSPRDHVRRTYRNFFHPHQRWPFCGLRLARDLT
ncbi:MAG: ergothioneine biosynthesis protein EgtB [Alphaproteobacteria bacterium]|nr:ergothioneine biosynthesis protein EgtB [Alphaproteobacteria bacterium]